MNYNDIIIILLLVIIIGLVLFKNDNTYFTQSDKFKNITPPDNYIAQNYIPTNAQQNIPMNMQQNNQYKNLNYQQYASLPVNSTAQNLNINKRLDNIKKNKNKSSIIIKNNVNNEDELNSNNDLGSLDDISLNKTSTKNKKYNIKKTLISESKNKNNNDAIKKNKTNEINKKVIIDDYSEFDNIKSLNSMDNTLSDVVSIIERE
jgi:hypothetical protein